MKFSNIFDIKKAYTEGIYADTPQNRKLGRVGMSYVEYAAKTNQNKDSENDDIKDSKIDFKNWDFLFPLGDITKKFGLEVYYPNATPNNAIDLGSKSFLKGKLWKLAILSGLGAHSLSWKDNGFTFSKFSSGLETEVNKTKKWLDNLGIKYNDDTNSQGGFQYHINISKSKENIERINYLYQKFFDNWEGKRNENIEKYKNK